MLLAHGDYYVHSAPREALQADLRAHASGIGAPHDAPPPLPTRPPAAAAPAAAAASPPPDAQGWRAFAARISVPSPQSSAASGANTPHAAAAAEAQPSSVVAGAGAQAEAALQPADPDEDIFGLGSGDLAWQGSGVAAPQDAATGGSSAQQQVDPMAALEEQLPAHAASASNPGGSPQLADGGGGAWGSSPARSNMHAKGMHAAAQHQAAACQAAEQERSVSLSSASHEDTCMAYHEAGGAADEDNAEGPMEEPPPMEGFELDSASGFFYNSLLGAFFDPKRQLFGDAATGHWYSLRDGEYQLVH